MKPRASRAILPMHSSVEGAPETVDVYALWADVLCGGGSMCSVLCKNLVLLGCAVESALCAYNVCLRSCIIL